MRTVWIQCWTVKNTETWMYEGNKFLGGPADATLCILVHFNTILAPDPNWFFEI